MKNSLTNQLDAITEHILYTVKLYNNGDIEIVEGVLQDGNRELFKNSKLEVTPKRVHVLDEKNKSLYAMPFTNIIQIMSEDMWKKS